MNDIESKIFLTILSSYWFRVLQNRQVSFLAFLRNFFYYFLVWKHEKRDPNPELHYLDRQHVHLDIFLSPWLFLSLLLSSILVVMNHTVLFSILIFCIFLRISFQLSWSSLSCFSSSFLAISILIFFCWFHLTPTIFSFIFGCTLDKLLMRFWGSITCRLFCFVFFYISFSLSSGCLFVLVKKNFFFTIIIILHSFT